MTQHRRTFPPQCAGGLDGLRNQAITLTVRVWPGLGMGESRANRDVEKWQVVAGLQWSCRAKRKRALRGRNHAEGYPGGLIETMNGGVKTRSCAAQPPSDRKTPCP
jgi:hypothetical protein